MYSPRLFFANRIAIAAIAAALLSVTGTSAVASGWPPFAFDDNVTVKRGATVSVLTTGQASVLANDFDFERDRLTVILTRSPKRGDLTLNEDGTFVYRHLGSNKDSDEFRYRAFDGTGYSREAKVRIEITPGEPIPPQIVGQRAVSVPEDGTVQIRLQDLEVFDPDNDYPRDFTLEVGDGDNYTRNDASISPVADYNGPLTVPVRVNDGTNSSNWFDLRVDVTPGNDAPFVVSPIPDQEAVEDDEFVLSVAEHFDDIDDGDVLRFSARGLPSSRTIRINPRTGILRGTPIRADAKDTPYAVRITATDLAGANATLTFALTIFPNNRADMAVFSSVRENPTLVGEPTSWSIDLENRGPAQLEEGELISAWTTSGPALSLAAPAGCTIESNDSPTPLLRCPLTLLPVGATLTFDVAGMQAADGDNTLIAEVIADDPVLENNTSLVSAQVAVAFSEGPTQTLNQAGADLAAADFNGDGLPDLVASSEKTVLYLNRGDRTLQSKGTVVGDGGSQLALLDWNGDGANDIAVAGPSAGSARVFLGDGAGQFISTIEFSTRVQGQATELAAADLNGDGTSELIMSGTFGVLTARGRDSRNPRVEVLFGGSVLDVAVTNLNQDGFPDLVSVAGNDRSVRLLRNTGNGSFVTQGSIREGSVARVSAADLNNDGASDLLLAIDGEDMSPPHTKLLYRQSNGDFVVANTLGASTASDLVTGDVNLDGELDIVAVTEAGVHQVYLATADDAQYTLGAEQIVSPGMRQGIMLDFNADESFDLILAGRDAAGLELHANNGIGRLGLGDRIAPELNLIGAANLTVPAGTDYTDAGATAVDDIDGDLTAAIVTTGSVNPAVVGVYSITYTVADRASNTSQVTRTVNVGVNQGAGGGGGGLPSPLTLLVLGMFASLRAGRSREA